MRLIKQFVFGIIFLIIFSGIGFGVWYLSIERPTCFDGIKNGDEEGIDCGLLACGQPCPPPIQDLIISQAQVLNVQNDEYDFIFQAINPNQVHGAVSVRYNLILKDRSGEISHQEKREFFILPGQIKNIVVPAIKESGEVASAEVKIEEAVWQGYDPIGTVQFPLRSEEREQTSSGLQYRGVIVNDSNFDFDSVEVRVVVRDSQGKIAAVHAVPVLTLLAHTERHFILSWPYDIANFEDPTKTTITVEADTNLFKNSNFLRAYGTGGELFQKFY